MGRSIYLVGDLYSGYNQFQLAMQSRDITAMQTPLGLVWMCALPKGGTNSVAHMVNAMNKVWRDCIPDITMLFLDDIPIKGFSEDTKEESIETDGCKKFVTDHISNFEKILQKLDDARLTFSREKSAFGQSEILVVECWERHLVQNKSTFVLPNVVQPNDAPIGVVPGAHTIMSDYDK